MPTVRPVPADTVRPLRTAVLRPDWPPGRLLTFDEDDQAQTVHVAAETDGAVVGVGTVYPQPPPPALRGPIPEAAFAPGVAYAPGAAYQLRGMATAEAVRRTGVGAAVLAACVEAVRDGGGAFAWCNARIGAVEFYRRAGWTAVGETFEVAGVGPHVVMWKSL